MFEDFLGEKSDNTPIEGGREDNNKRKFRANTGKKKRKEGKKETALSSRLSGGGEGRKERKEGGNNTKVK